MIGLSRKFVSSLFGKTVDILEKCYGSSLEISDLFENHFDYIKELKKISQRQSRVSID